MFRSRSFLIHYSTDLFIFTTADRPNGSLLYYSLDFLLNILFHGPVDFSIAGRRRLSRTLLRLNRKSGDVISRCPEFETPIES